MCPFKLRPFGNSLNRVWGGALINLAFEEIYLILASAPFFEIIFYIVGVLSYLIFTSL